MSAAATVRAASAARTVTAGHAWSAGHAASAARTATAGHALIAFAATLTAAFTTILAPGQAARAQTSDDLPFVSMIPLDTRGLTIQAGDRLLVDVVTRRPADLLAALGASTVNVRQRGEAGDLRLELSGRDHFEGAPGPAHLRPSFVMDFDEPPVAALLAELGHDTREDEEDELARLARFVFDLLSDKTYARGFDIASRVAVSRAGDCTEHAVLLTALARARGHPARLVIGALIVPHMEMAFGHAWTEVHDGQSWRVLDATLPPATAGGGSDDVPAAAPRYYFPVGALENEGPGHPMDLMGIQLRLPPKVVVAARVDATGVQDGRDLRHGAQRDNTEQRDNSEDSTR